MNKAELSIAIAANTGLNKTTTYAVLTAIAQQLDAEAIAGRAVVLDRFGTFLPRRKTGQRTGRILGGGVATYDNWKLIPNPVHVNEETFITDTAVRAKSMPPLVAIVLQDFKVQIVRTLRRGGSVYDNGHGSFRVGKRKARVYHRADGSISSQTPPKKAIIYRAAKDGNHQKFVALANLI
jgi:nucleoid DNA-binding protein